MWHRKDEFFNDVALVGLSQDSVTRLARYNAEVRRGIVHTAQYDAEMAELQRLFNAQYAAQRVQQR
jgi:hypothetical protein